MSISPADSAPPLVLPGTTSKTEVPKNTAPGIALPSSGSDEFVKKDGSEKPGSALPGNSKSDTKPEGDSSKLSAVRAILKQILALFMSTATNANPIFRIAVNRIANNLLVGAASLIQGLLVDTGIKGTKVESEATALDSTVKSLVGFTNQNVQEHESTKKQEIAQSKEFNDLAKIA